MTDLVKTNNFLTPHFKLAGSNFFDLGDFFDQVLSASPLKTSIYKGNLSFAADVKMSDKELVMLFELPAIDTNTLDIKVDNRVLTVSAEKPVNNDEGYVYSRTEIAYGKYSRSYTIPTEYDLDSISSSYKNGVLTVSIQRKPETLARKVEVKFD